MHKRFESIKKAISTPDYVRILTLRTVGNFLVLFSLFTIAHTFYEPIKNEVRYNVDKLLQKTYVAADPIDLPPSVTPGAPTLTPVPTEGPIESMFDGKKVERIIPEDPNFGIVIPKIAANARILPDVNPADQTTYKKALAQGVAHAAGTAYPGEGGHIFLFAHSTDYWWNVGQYNAIFYLLYKLEKGDEVNIYYKGQRHKYIVTGQKIVSPDQVQYLTRKTPKEFLTLQTCWPPGTTLQRLLVFAVPVGEELQSQ